MSFAAVPSMGGGSPDYDQVVKLIIERLRLERGINSAALARKAGMFRQTLDRKLKPQSWPFSLTETVALCKALETSPEAVWREAGVLPEKNIESLIDGDPALDAKWREFLKVIYRCGVAESAKGHQGLSIGRAFQQGTTN